MAGKLTPALAVRLVQRWQQRTGNLALRQSGGAQHLRKVAIILAFVASEAVVEAAPPTFVANGASTVTAATGTCTPTWTGITSNVQAGDIILVVACGEGDTTGGTQISLSTANGFAAVSGITNPISGDDNDATEENPENDCAVFWKRAVGGDSAPVIADSGDHTTCAGHLFRGVKTTGNPWNVAASGNDSNANDTSGVIPGATTTVTDTLVVLVQGTSNNATGTANCGAVTNANLTSITERFDSSNTSGLGGGHCIITGQKAASGSYANSTLTMGATTYKAAFSVALEPAPPCTGLCRVAGQSTGGLAGPATSMSLPYPGNVTAGDLLVIGVSRWHAGSSDAIVVGDISQSAGTATLGSFTLDVDREWNFVSSDFLNSAVFSVPVTGTGSCTIQVGGGPSDASWIMGIQEYSGADTSGSRVLGTNEAQNTNTAPDSGTVAATGNVAFFGNMVNGAGTTVTTTEDGSFSLIFENENGTSNTAGSLIDRIVTSDTTDSASWTLGSSQSWIALLSVYKPSTAPPACNQSIALLGVGCR